MGRGAVRFLIEVTTCASWSSVTAYVLRELLGGEILIAPVHGSHLHNEHHAWNRLPSVKRST